MQSKPKIIVLKAREILYTLLLLLFLILLIICLILMFSRPKKTDVPNYSTSDTAAEYADASETPAPSSYTPGVYRAPITLGESTVDVEVTVDSDRIRAIRLVNLSEAAAASYPLVSPSLEHISTQILEKQTLEEITAPSENRYTSQLLLSAVAQALEVASGI